MGTGELGPKSKPPFPKTSGRGKHLSGPRRWSPSACPLSPDLAQPRSPESPRSTGAHGDGSQHLSSTERFLCTVSAPCGPSPVWGGLPAGAPWTTPPDEGETHFTAGAAEARGGRDLLGQWGSPTGGR